MPSYSYRSSSKFFVERNVFVSILMGISVFTIASISFCRAGEASSESGVESLRERIERKHPPYQTGEEPEWMANPVAMEALKAETVLAPWIPVQATSDSVKVWNREYEVGNGGLPKSILSSGKELLAGPVRLEVVVNGWPQSQVDDLTDLLEAKPGRATYLSKSATEAAKLETKAVYEFDGFTRFDTEIETAKPFTVSRLELVIPLKEEFATLFHGTFARRKLKRDKENESGTIPEGIGEVYSDEFMPYFWIGSEKGVGLAWYAESDEWVRPYRNDRVIRIVRRPGVVELRIAYVDKPTTLPGSLQLSYGLMATPVKPLPEGWQNWRVEWDWDAQPKFPVKPEKLHLVSWYNIWSLTPFSPVPRDPENYKKLLQEYAEKGAERVYAYLDVTLISTKARIDDPEGEGFVFESPEWKVFGKQWINIPEEAGADFDTASWYPDAERVSPASGWAEFSLWGVKNMITEEGLNGIYTDESFPYADTSEAHGAGFLDASGKRRPTWSLFAMRDYFKRLAWLFQKYGDGRPAIMAHTSMTIAVPYLSFVDIAIDGEHFALPTYEWEKPGLPSYVDMIPADYFRAQLMSQQFGFVPFFLPTLASASFRRAEPFPNIDKLPGPTRELLALTLVHSTQVWPLYCNRAEVDAANEILAEFNTGDPETEFVPYWTPNNKVAVNSRADRLLSYYKNGDRLLVVVSNLSANDEVTEIDFKNICGTVEGLEVTDAASKALLPHQGGKVFVKIPPKDFRLISIAPKSERSSPKIP